MACDELHNMLSVELIIGKNVCRSVEGHLQTFCHRERKKVQI